MEIGMGFGMERCSRGVIEWNRLVGDPSVINI